MQGDMVFAKAHNLLLPDSIAGPASLKFFENIVNIVIIELLRNPKQEVMGSSPIPSFGAVISVG
jgi:hypothetical protein